MREKFTRFMAGRYGTDSLNQFLSILSIACLVLALITRVTVFYWLGVVLLVYMYFRSFSRNIPQRTAENYKFYTLKERLFSKTGAQRAQWASRRQYHYYSCPQCRQKLRVPRGRGRIEITCPRCGTRFVKKS